MGYKVANSSEPFRYHNLEASAAALYRPEATLKGLHKFTGYLITVQAFNAAGAGPRTPPLTAATEEDGETGGGSLTAASVCLLLSYLCFLFHVFLL